MTELTAKEELARLEVIKKKGSISAFDCIFHSSQIVKKQNELTTAEKIPAQVSQQQVQMQKPARRKRHSSSKEVSND